MATTVQGGFDELLRSLSLTDYEAEIAAGRVRNVQAIFSAKYACARTPWAIGSYGRETIVRWKRDIDIMVALDDTYWPRYQSNSRAFLYDIRNMLNDAYGDTTVSSKQVAVRMMLSGGLQVDLVPTFVHDYGGFLMPNGQYGWQRTNPPYHDALMTAANARLQSRLKPLVRLMKAWNQTNGSHLRSFHLEMIVERIWQNATSLPRTPDAVATMLTYAGSWVRSAFPDPWVDSGQRLDTYLSNETRASVADNLDRDAGTAKAALDAEAAGRIDSAFSFWNIVFYKKFPAYG